VLTEDAGAGPARHVIPADWLDTLFAGGGSPEITRLFWRTERSRRLLLISALLDEAKHRPDLLGPLPPADSAWDALAAAQAAPAGIDPLLLHPQVGSWAAYALRRQRGGAASGLPLWVDFGGVQTLALVAAARAGLSWQTSVPLRSGHVMLPTLGMARFADAGPAGVAQAETSAGRIRLRCGGQDVEVPTDPGVDAPHWWGLRRIWVGDDLVLSAWLDDLDPFRDLADPVPPARLDAAGFARWSSLLTDAWAVLCRDHRPDAEALAGGVVSLVPLSPEEGWGTRSASNGEAFGSVMMSPPPDPVTLAVSLVHEFQHIKLGALMHLLQLTEDDGDRLYYAPWRDDPRPLGGLLQGVYAFLGIAGFWRRALRTVSGPDAAVAAFEYAYARAQTDEALRIIRPVGALTPDGRDLVTGLTARMAPWLAEPLPADITATSQLTADSHRTAWRLRHLHPEPDEIAGLAREWLAVAPPSGAGRVPPRLRPHGQAQWPQRIPALARARVVALARGERDDRGAVADPSATALALADAALAAGDAGTARDRYLTCIARGAGDREEPDNLEAWTGLAVAVAGEGPELAARALLARPDLVRAVHAEVAATAAAPDPVALAAWIGAALPPPDAPGPGVPAPSEGHGVDVAVGAHP
jgi:HEXXH motif-containing protein